MRKANRLKILDIDPYLKPHEADLRLRMDRCESMKKRLLGTNGTFSSFANGYLYYGFHRTHDGWVYREWAPGASAISLLGDFNGWSDATHRLEKLPGGNWEIHIRDAGFGHGSLVKLRVWANATAFERIPLYIKRVVQDPVTKVFCGQVWQSEQAFEWTDAKFIGAGKSVKAPLIYECHVGMASELEGVATYAEFTKDILPRIKRLGYNTAQLMAIMEHPYYGSFGYQVSNFFAPSSRFGTPDELKTLINTAHEMGISVLLDLVHSHAVRNTAEGINEFDGTPYQFFHVGARGDHPAWDTKLFNYGKPEVLHFLLSNIKYWLEEYHFDGFRFDGVTSMLYHDHALGECFDNYQKYFSMNTDLEAVTYLQFANELIKEVRPGALSIAEDMSGMPGMCLKVRDGGLGFDYRLGMGVPDYWIKTVAKVRDEDWDIGRMWYELTTRRPQEKNIGYCESHDQALVGDKTIMFWLADKEMYYRMDLASRSHIIDRAIALHKLIRLVTSSLAGEGYLNFMGNEFGHPEWIDFPREGNGWSYKYARRQWSLAENDALRYKHLLNFDIAMLRFVRRGGILRKPPKLLCIDEGKKLLVFEKGGYVFSFNFHPHMAATVSIPVQTGGEYRLALNTDWEEFGGSAPKVKTIKANDESGSFALKLSVDARCALVAALKPEG